MISIENMIQQGPTGQGGGGGGDPHRGISHELPTAYVTSTPLPLAKAQQQHPSLHSSSSHPHNHPHPHLPPHHHHHPHPHQHNHHPSAIGTRMMSDEDKAETEKNAIISSLFEEIRLEATLFGDCVGGAEKVKQEAPDDEPTALAETPQTNVNKKLKKRKSEIALEMTADDVDDILGDSAQNGNFNPKNPFGGTGSNTGGFVGDLGSPGSSSFNSNSQKSSPPLSKYSQNNQGQRNSPPTQSFPNMSPYMTPQMNSPLQQHHPQLQQQNSVTSSSPVAMHSPGQVPEFKPTIMNGVVMNPLHHHMPHHTRFLQHQQSAPNLRLNTPDESNPPPPPPHPHPLYLVHGGPPPPGPNRQFDRSLVDEFEMCVRSVLMASHRCYCRHVYRQLTAEVSELYARVAKNQVPKKAVKKIIAARQPATAGERIELERQFKCLSDGLESRQSESLYESILNFLYKMRVAIPDAY